MNWKELRDYIPVMKIEDDCLVSKRGDLTYGWRVYLPVAYSVNEPGYDSIIATFLQAYKLLPPYCVVHKQDIFRYDIYHAEHNGEFLHDSYENHFEGRKYLNGYCYIFLTFSSKTTIEAKTGSSLMFSLGSAKALDPKKIEACAGIASQFGAVLKNNPLLVVDDLKNEDYLSVDEHGKDLGLLADYLRLFEEPGGIDYPLEFDKSSVRVGDNIVKAWYIEDSDSYPGMVNTVRRIDSMSTASSEVYLSGGSPIGYQLAIPHIVNRYVVTLPRKAVETELDRKMRMMNSFSLYSASCRVNSEEIATYLEESARDSAITVKCFTDVLAWGKPEDMTEIRNHITTAFSDLDVTVAEERLVAPNLHYAGIPGAAAELGAEFYMTSEMNAFLCHGLWDGYDFGMKGGAIKLCDRRRMVPVTLDTQSVARELGYVDNLNAVVVGPSGSGKSFTMNTLVRNFYNSDQHILVIDVGDSYQGLCQIVNEETGGKDGVYNSYDPENPFGFNPFRGRRTWNEIDEDGERKGSGLDFLLSLIETMYEPAGGWTKQVTGLLSSLVNEFFALWDNGYTDELTNSLREAYVNKRRARAEKQRKTLDEVAAARGFHNPLPDIFSKEGIQDRDPLFDDFFRYITMVVGPLVNDENYELDNITVRKDMFDIDQFGIALSKYKLGGEYGYFLNTQEEKDLFSSRLTVFEVDKIKGNQDLFPLWMLCILHSFEDKMRSLPCQKVMVIEEAWSAIAKPTMANFIVWMWRTARKFRTSAIVVTQSITDLLASPIIKDAIVQNSSVKILLDQSKKANDFDESAKILGLSPKDVGLVLSVGKNMDPRYRYKEGFFSIGEHFSNVYAIEVSMEEALAYESDKTKKKPVFDLAKECGSMIEAIKRIASDKRNKR